MIVRENSEGEYAGVGGRAHRGLPIEVGMDVSVFTRAGVERICRFACELAMSRPRKQLTVVTKSNAQRHGMVFWDDVCREVVARLPRARRRLEAGRRDDARAWCCGPAPSTRCWPRNLHADILSDLASALAGSLGIGATANIDPERARPLHVRADPRLGLRSHRQGHGESARRLLDRRA